jgi:hypothetical protein
VANKYDGQDGGMLTITTVDSMSMLADGTGSNQRINARDTDLSGARKTPKGRSSVEQYEEYECGSHLDLKGKHRVV